jgi:hypothetical protein
MRVEGSHELESLADGPCDQRRGTFRGLRKQLDARRRLDVLELGVDRQQQRDERDVGHQRDERDLR